MTTKKSNNIEDLKIGQKIISHFYGTETILTITNITKTRIVCDTNTKHSTATGRSSSKFWQGKKSFQEELNSDSQVRYELI